MKYMLVLYILSTSGWIEADQIDFTPQGPYIEDECAYYAANWNRLIAPQAAPDIGINTAVCVEMEN